MHEKFPNLTNEGTLSIRDKRGTMLLGRMEYHKILMKKNEVLK